jgi:opacity protein-like surface antigen
VIRKMTSVAVCRLPLLACILAIVVVLAGTGAAFAQNPEPETVPPGKGEHHFPVPHVTQPPDWEEFLGEFYGGISYLHADPGHGFPQSNYYGWNGQITEWANPWFGMAIDAAGEYGKIENPFGPSAPGKVGADQVSAMAGPKFRLLRTKHVAGALFGFMGMGRAHVDERNLDNLATATGQAVSPLEFNDQFKLAFAAGGQADVRLTHRWAWRVQPCVYFSRIAQHTQTDFRISTGPVIRFGVSK